MDYIFRSCPKDYYKVFNILEDIGDIGGGKIRLPIFHILDNNKFFKWIKFFKRNWLNLNFIDFYIIGDEKIKNRTNNKIELFHRALNQTIESHPKISFFVEKLKMIITNKYR